MDVREAAPVARVLLPGPERDHGQRLDSGHRIEPDSLPARLVAGLADPLHLAAQEGFRAGRAEAMYVGFDYALAIRTGNAQHAAVPDGSTDLIVHGSRSPRA